MMYEYMKSLARLTGIKPKNLYFFIKGIPVYFYNLVKYKMGEEKNDKFPIQLSGLYPRYGDRYKEAGSARGHYFHQDIWAAKKIYENNPVMHIDIGSRIDGFISHLLIFREVVVLDIRELVSDVPGLKYEKADVTNLKFEDSSLESISCLHAIEHIGLGRYGDMIDGDGWSKGLSEIQRVLRPGGKLYLGVPIGKEKLFYDAHRVFSPETIVESLPELNLVSFSYVNDEGAYKTGGVDFEVMPMMKYGCGLFEFTK